MRNAQRAVRQLDRGRGQSARRGRHHPLLFQAGTGRPDRAAADRRSLQGAVRDRPVPGRAHQPVRRPDRRDRGRESGHQPDRLRGQQEGQGRAAQARDPVEGARHALARRWSSPTCSASSRSIGAAAASTSASTRRSSSCRTAASISCSRSTRASKTGVKTIEFVGNRAYSALPAEGRDQDRRNRPARRSCRPPTSTIPTASRPIASCCGASISSTAISTCASCRRWASSIRRSKAS